MFEIADSVGMRFSILNPVCMGATYDQAWIARESEASDPRRHMRVYEHSYMAGRLGPAGLNLFAATEGVFGSTHTKNGVAMIRLAGLEAPEQIGRVERRGAMLKR